MYFTRIVLVSFLLIIGTCQSGVVAQDQRIWKVAGRPDGDIHLWLRPASNRAQGWGEQITVKAGNSVEGVGVPLKNSDPIDVRMLFLNKEGNITESWASNDPVYFAKMDLSKTTQLKAVAMVEQILDKQGQMQMVNKHVLYDSQRAMILVSLRDMLILHKALSPRPGSTLKLNGAAMLDNMEVRYSISGEPEAPVIELEGGRTLQLSMIFLELSKSGGMVITGEYRSASPTTTDKSEAAGQFIFTRRPDFLADATSIEYKPHPESKWRQLQAASTVVQASAKVENEELKFAIMAARDLLEIRLSRLDQRMQLFEEREEKISDQLFEVSLKLTNPAVHEVLTKCVECHRSKPKGPRFYSRIEPTYRAARPEVKTQMIELAELTKEQEKLLFQFTKTTPEAK